MCVDRQQIIQVVFSGYADPTESLLGDIAKPWQSTDYPPLKFDCAAANQTLDQLGYKKGSDGIRVAPATTGKYAEPAHKMQYQVMVPNSLDFNGDRTFSIVQEGFENAGVKLTRAERRRLERRVCDRNRRQVRSQDEHRVLEVRHRPVGLGRIA